MAKKKLKRKLNGKFLALVAAVLLVALSIYKVPHFINTNKLLDLGYSNEAVKAIYDKGLRKTILKNNYYSEYLNQEVVKDTFNKNYLKLYVVSESLSDSSFELYEKLKDKKSYSDEELEKLFGSLNDYNIAPLLIFDKVDNLDEYIEDCNNHKENNKDVFVVDGDYLHPYENFVEIEDVYNEEVFVSCKHSLGNYIPEKLVQINSLNSIPGVFLESRALEAYDKMCKAIREEDLNMAIYAIGGYISYDNQKQLYLQSDGRLKEGFADTQTGLGVYVTNEETNSFKDSRVYKWLIEHCHEYGFIQRYPEGKECLTGHSCVYNYFRYVGIDLASKIFNSGLSFDEYYYYN